MFHPIEGFSEIALAAVQLETIALSPDAEDGIGYIRSTTANNMNFSQTQAATQATQGGSSSAGTQVHALLVQAPALLPCSAWFSRG